MRVIHVLRKPLSEGTVAANVLKHGCGGLNIDASRIAGEPWTWGTQTDIRGGGYGSKRPSGGDVFATNVQSDPKGRWPANVILQHLDGCRCDCEPDCPVSRLDGQSGVSTSSGGRIGDKDGGGIYGGGKGLKGAYEKGDPGFGDKGGPSRFFKQIGGAE